MRCQQVTEELSYKKHRLQVLTSNYRVPPGGVPSDKGVFRELVLFADLADNELSKLSYQDVLAIDLENAAILDDRISRFKPDLVLVWDCAQLPKSMLMRLQQTGLVVAFDLHGDWLKSDHFRRDPWQWWWKSDSSFRAKLRKFRMTISGEKRRIQRKLPIYDRSDLDFSNSWAASRSLRDSLSKDGVKGLENLPVIYSALNSDSIEVKCNYTTNGRLMWAGRLTAGKAPEIALEAVAKLKSLGEEVSLDIFGMGEPIERKAIRERINAMGLDDCVEIVAIRPGEIFEHYSNYDALLVTSICDDPFPMTPIEAIMSGLPCILSKDGGIQEIVEDGKTALLFDRGNPDALVEAIQRFLAQPDAGASMAVECKRQLAEQYSMENYVDQVQENVFSKLKAQSK